VTIRYMVTLPIGLGLFFGASFLANSYYNNEALFLPLRIFGLVILVEGVQGMLNSVTSGTKRFKQLFLYQATIAFVSLCLYLPLVYYYRVNGFFLAMLFFGVIRTIILGFIALWPLRGNLILPSKSDYIHLVKTVLSVGIAIYVVKVLYTYWENLPPNLLGPRFDQESLGYLTFAIFYANKLISISDAVTDVNLPVMSDKYANNFKDFKNTFISNFNKLFVFIVFSGTVATYWVVEVLNLFFRDGKFENSYVYVLPLVVAFGSYAFINIIKSSVFIPAKLNLQMITSYLILFLSSLGTFFVSKDLFSSDLYAIAISLGVGGLFGLITIGIFASRHLKFQIFNIDHLAIAVQALFIARMNIIAPLAIKVPMFIVFIFLFVWANFIARFLTKDDVKKYAKALKVRLNL